VAIGDYQVLIQREVADDFRLWPSLCENAKPSDRDRISSSLEAVFGAHIASAFNFKIEIENIIITLRTFEFSHSLSPGLPTGAMQQVGSYLGYSGRGADPFGSPWPFSTAADNCLDVGCQG
jgi:hypothetical protein